MEKIYLPFRLEAWYLDKWVMLQQDQSKLYLEGLATGWNTVSPHAGYRLVRHRDSKVLKEWLKSDTPQMGAVAGWPTPEQCIDAAIRALKQVPSGRCGSYPTPGERTAIQVALMALEVRYES